jgi:serine/threonine-protein kinase
VFVVRKPAVQQPPPPEVVQVQPERPPEPVRQPPTEPTRPVEPPPVEKKKVTVNLFTEPSGAAVTVDGQPGGITPAQLVFEEGAPAKSVTFALPGHQPVMRPVSAENAPQLVVELPANPRPTSNVRQTGGKKPPFGIKSGR